LRFTRLFIVSEDLTLPAHKLIIDSSIP